MLHDLGKYIGLIIVKRIQGVERAIDTIFNRIKAICAKEDGIVIRLIGHKIYFILEHASNANTIHGLISIVDATYGLRSGYIIIFES